MSGRGVLGACPSTSPSALLEQRAFETALPVLGLEEALACKSSQRAVSSLEIYSPSTC